MRVERSRVTRRSYPGIGMLLLAAALAIAPLNFAYAYIDPNSAGPLYQLLFPLFIAVAGVLAALRRIIKQLWFRAIRACVGFFRHERGSTDGEHLP